MPSVKDAFSELTDEDIQRFGELGVSPDIVFKSLGFNEKSKKVCMSTSKWKVNYDKGLGKREIELAEKLSKSTDPRIVLELLKSTSLTDKKFVDDNAEFVVECPEWMQPKVKRNAGKKK